MENPIILTPEEEELKKEIILKTESYFGKTVEEATEEMIYTVSAMACRDEIMSLWLKSHKNDKERKSKKLYYLSFEFLMGKMFETNLINLLKTSKYENVLKSLGFELSNISEKENDAGLGNGGLGRLASCFIDSLTTLDLPAYGCTIRYEYGLFKQKIVDGYQTELPDSWLDKINIWEIPRPEETVTVKFGGNVYTDWKDGRFIIRYENTKDVLAVPYDIPIAGYNSQTVNNLRMWKAECKNDFDMNEFNRGNYLKAIEESNSCKVISKVLYPEDNHQEGKELRLKQQYFLVSATIQWIVNEFAKEYGNDFKELPEKVIIHINDTHPTLAIPELMRILLDEKGLSWNDSMEIVKKVFAYTNHTVMSEALEKWPIGLFYKLLPRIAMITEEMNRRLMEDLQKLYPGDNLKHRYMAIISDNKVNMANICLYTCFAVNGVSELHTKILTDDIFKDYFKITPEKFHAITNGITFRRWIVKANPELTSLINSKISNQWITDAKLLDNIQQYADDEDFQNEFYKIKLENKKKLAEYILENNGIEVDVNSIFDVQAKRLHEYKRQLMNILHIMAEYNSIVENPDMEYYPKTYIFAAKAAPGYMMAKKIIKLINNVSEIINNDKRINNKIKVVFLENYGVSLAEKVVVAADISEQISTCTMEASGTGNMKFMLNGAITIGTLDGANVEMKNQVGSENIYIFGKTEEEVKKIFANNNRSDVEKICTGNKELTKVLDQLKNGELSNGNTDTFSDIYKALLYGEYQNPDCYLVIRDFEDYMKTQRELSKLYSDRKKWLKKAIMNTAKSGYFSSDRTVSEYNNKIWHLSPMNEEKNDN